MIPDLEPILKFLWCFALIGLTFGIWKIIEIICWLFTHIQITLQLKGGV